MEGKWGLKAFAAAAALGIMSLAPANAATVFAQIGTGSGNICPSNTFGSPFSACSAEGSAVVAKIDSSGTEFNSNASLFPNGSFANTEFDASLNQTTTTVSWDTSSFGTDPDTGAPLGILIKYVGVKIGGPGGGSWFLYSVNGGEGAFTGEGTLPLTGSFSHDVSNVNFFNSVEVIPLPAAAWLLLSGMGALGVVGYRRRKTAA